MLMTYSFRRFGGRVSGTDVKPAFRQEASPSRSQRQLLTHGPTSDDGNSSVVDDSVLYEGSDDVTDIRNRKTKNVSFISKCRF